MRRVLTRLYDRSRGVYVECWLTDEQFENLPDRYCLPYEVGE